jgi:hypothetical protein
MPPRDRETVAAYVHALKSRMRIIGLMNVFQSQRKVIQSKLLPVLTA